MAAVASGCAIGSSATGDGATIAALQAAAGWEKEQVENQVGNPRDQIFRPKPKVASLGEPNTWLEDQCIACAKRTHHPEFKDRTIWEMFQEEKPAPMEFRSPFDGFVEKAVRASTTCLVMADQNRPGVDPRAAGQALLVRTSAEWMMVLFEDEIAANHPPLLSPMSLGPLARLGSP